MLFSFKFRRNEVYECASVFFLFGCVIWSVMLSKVHEIKGIVQ
jgi:hypothetical protein